MINVTGFPCSGLSLVSQIIQKMDYHVEDKAKEINQALLAQMTTTREWYELTLTWGDVMYRKEVEAFQASAKFDFSNHSNVVCSDPLFCILSDFWGQQMKYVIAVRNPLTTVHLVSHRILSNYDNVSLNQLLTGWLHYYTSILDNVSANRRMVVCYEDMIYSDYRRDTAVYRISEFLNAELYPRDVERIGREVVNYNRSKVYDWDDNALINAAGRNCADAVMDLYTKLELEADRSIF